jgi:chromosome segregation ATPase
LLGEANTTEDLETLVRLTQKLRAIKKNVEIVAANTVKAYEGEKGLNAKHDAASAAILEAMASLDAEIFALNDQEALTKAQIEEKKEKKMELDTAPEIKAAKAEVKELEKALKEIKKENPDYEMDANYQAKKSKLAELKASIETLTKTGQANKKDIKKVQSEIDGLKKEIAVIAGKRKSLGKKWVDKRSELPYGLVHPGSWTGENKSGTNGQLQNVVSLQGMGTFIVKKPKETKPEKKKK